MTIETSALPLNIHKILPIRWENNIELTGKLISRGSSAFRKKEKEKRKEKGKIFSEKFKQKKNKLKITI